MTNRPRGTVTFIFTDIEGSTFLWERNRSAMVATVDRHLTLLRTAIESHGGVLFKTVGHGTRAAFLTALDAVADAPAHPRSASVSQPDRACPLREPFPT